MRGRTDLTKTVVKSHINLKVQSLGVVELRAFLVDSPAVNTVFKIAFVNPVLQLKDNKKIKAHLVRFGLKVKPACGGMTQ